MRIGLGVQDIQGLSLSTAVGLQTASGSITAASNASPIQITSAGHGLATGAVVILENVGGNTNANGAWVITVVDANNFTLNGSSGNAAYTSGGDWRQIPAGAQFVEISCEGANVRYRDDGTDPTSTLGSLIKSSDPPKIYRGNLQKIKFIGESGTPNLTINFFKII